MSAFNSCAGAGGAVWAEHGIIFVGFYRSLDYRHTVCIPGCSFDDAGHPVQRCAPGITDHILSPVPNSAGISMAKQRC